MARSKAKSTTRTKPTPTKRCRIATPASFKTPALAVFGYTGARVCDSPTTWFDPYRTHVQAAAVHLSKPLVAVFGFSAVDRFVVHVFDARTSTLVHKNTHVFPGALACSATSCTWLDDCTLALGTARSRAVVSYTVPEITGSHTLTLPRRWTGQNKIVKLRALRASQDTLVAVCADRLLVIARDSDVLLYASCLTCSPTNVCVYQNSAKVHVLISVWGTSMYKIDVPLKRVSNRALHLAASLESAWPWEDMYHAHGAGLANVVQYACGYLRRSSLAFFDQGDRLMQRLELHQLNRSIIVGTMDTSGFLQHVTVQPETGNVVCLFGAPFRTVLFEARTARYVWTRVVLSYQ